MPNIRGDAELITAARKGDTEAYGELYRRHFASAVRFARSLAGRSMDAEDLVADAFARVLAALSSGDGPVEAFRPYLLSAVRNAFYDQARRAAREQPVDEVTPLAPEVPFVDPVMFKDESRLVASAFGELPERWKVVLWHTEVEGEKAAEVAPLLGISANAVSALAYRAREGLRERYLQAHVGSATDEHCRPTVARLAAYTRRKLSDAQMAKVRHHLDRCDRCRLLFGELADLNSRLGALLGPVVLGGAAAVHLAASGAAGAGAAATAGVGLARLLFRPEVQAAGGIAVAAGVVAMVLPFFLEPSSGPDLAEPIAVPPAVASPSTSPAQTPRPTPSGADSTTGAPEPTTQIPPTVIGPAGGVSLMATLEPLGPLVRGRPGLLLLTVTNPPAAKGGATVAVDAVLSLPQGVTLRVESAGHGWTCSNSGAVTCRQPTLKPGWTTKAHVQLTVAPDASDGVPFVLLSGPDVRPVIATASRGVTSTSLSAVMATTAQPGWPLP